MQNSDKLLIFFHWFLIVSFFEKLEVFLFPLPIAKREGFFFFLVFGLKLKNKFSRELFIEDLCACRRFLRKAGKKAPK
jgi:hypothetical protein